MAPALERAFSGPVNAAAERHAATARGFLRANRDLLLLEDPDQEQRRSRLICSRVAPPWQGSLA